MGKNNSFQKPKGTNPMLQKLSEEKRREALDFLRSLSDETSSDLDKEAFLDETSDFLPSESTLIREPLIDVVNKQNQNTQIFYNFSSKYVFTNIDKIKLCIIDYDKNLEGYYDITNKINNAKISAINYVVLFFSLILTFMSTNFKQLILSAEIWKFLFICASLAWFILSIYYIKKYFGYKKLKDSYIKYDVNFIIKRLKRG